MLLPEYIIEKQPMPVKKNFRYWAQFMENHLSFSLSNSELHTKGHSTRVLLYSLIMGWQRLEEEDSLRILSHTAIFHDTRRLDDGLDKGHGTRAASYYQDFCDKAGIGFSPMAFDIIKNHDQDDEVGLNQITSGHSDSKSIELYRIFKDADALDRFRFGPNGLDARFLRNREAFDLIYFAESLARNTVSADEMQRVMDYIKKHTK